MNISTDQRKAALYPGRTRFLGGGRLDGASDAAFTVHHNDGDAVDIHSQYGEYVYEHQKVAAGAKIAAPCLKEAGTNMQSVMDCWQGTLRQTG